MTAVIGYSGAGKTSLLNLLVGFEKPDARIFTRALEVVRSAPDANGKSQTFELDMQQILEDGKVDKDVFLQPNDLIIVPSRLVNF